jgi:dipeptidyl aminopeptidase/acylaminoacyl peptidase
MNPIKLRSAFVLVGALVFALVSATAHAADPGPLNIKQFFKRPLIAAPALSPNGRYLAIRVSGDDDKVRLAVLDLQALSTPKIVAGFADVDIYSHQWVNDQRLVFDVDTPQNGRGALGNSGVWAVDRDGDNYKQLIENQSYGITGLRALGDKILPANWALHGLPGDGSDDIVVERRRWSNDAESTSVVLSRLNTRTGARRNISDGAPDHVRNWTLDWRGEPAALMTLKEGRASTHLRGPDGAWKAWQNYDPYRGEAHDTPVWFGPDGLALVSTSYKGHTAIFKFNPQTLQRTAQPFISFEGYDARVKLVFDQTAQELLGFHFETDAPASHWLNAWMRQQQALVDTRLPATNNRIDCVRCLTSARWVVTALSDRAPPIYYLFTPATGVLENLAASRPWVQPASMGARDVVRVPTRDGLNMPVLITQPAPASPKPAAGRPAVVLVHGGPYVRGTHWAWEPTAQFLASRGYVVIEPEFRGSTGYGFDYFKAGWKQWGLAMQDDVADALAWAVKQGFVDPARVCIAGASYGGYAALMGVIRHPDLYRCAVNWVGVTDIELMYTVNWSDFSSEWKQWGMPALVGDRTADAAQLRATSPLQRAAEIQRPLLMAYGGEDRRVPLKHGTDLRAALRPDQALEWVVYPDEGHGWRTLKTQEDFWGRVERFLAQHTAPAAPSRR